MRINQIKEPLAIAMWDSSWLRRRYPGGGFESFDKALDELKERGYNAVRIDAFPHFLAKAPDGTNSDRFLDPSGVGHHKYGFAQWGSPWTVYIYPRRDIVEFIKKCEERNIYIILSTWLKPTSEPRNEWIEGPMGLVRVWDEALEFLDENDCLNNVIAVDVQNEIPWGACNTWLANNLKELQGDAQLGWNKPIPKKQKDFYRNYFYTVINELKKRWKDIPFSASIQWNFYKDDIDMDYSCFDWLDVHLWAEWAPCAFLEGTPHYNSIAQFGEVDNLYKQTNDTYAYGAKRIPADMDFEIVNEKILNSWLKNRNECDAFLEERIAHVAEVGKKYNIPYGCTEGWGMVTWVEHPLLTWDIIKDAGLIAARLGNKYGYTFNCQSNFCEPQFVSLWQDVDYHKKVTDIIRHVVAKSVKQSNGKQN